VSLSNTDSDLEDPSNIDYSNDNNKLFTHESNIILISLNYDSMLDVNLQAYDDPTINNTHISNDIIAPPPPTEPPLDKSVLPS